MAQTKILDLKEGDTLIVVGEGFICMKKNDYKKVIADYEGNLFVDCGAGAHYLDGQVADDGSLVGLRKVDKADG